MDAPSAVTTYTPEQLAQLEEGARQSGTHIIGGSPLTFSDATREQPLRPEPGELVTPMSGPGGTCPNPWNNWLGMQYESKPWCMYGGFHWAIRYLNSHLYYLSNQATSICNPQFNHATGIAVENYRRFWGLGAVYGQHWQVVDDAMWLTLDWHTTL